MKISRLKMIIFFLVDEVLLILRVEFVTVPQNIPCINTSLAVSYHWMPYCSSVSLSLIIMLIVPIVEFFKYKVVSGIIVLACWPHLDQVKFIRQISQHGLRATFSCDATIFDHVDRNKLQGVLFIGNYQNNLIEKTRKEHFSNLYKWLVVADQLPSHFRQMRYDTDIVFLKQETDNNIKSQTQFFYDVYVHPRDGATTHPWAIWSQTGGFQLTHDQERIRRRQDLKNYPLQIATPIAHYSSESYDGAFLDYLTDESISDRDPGVRSGYHMSKLLIEAVNASDILIENELWSTLVNNNSMYLMLSEGTADLAGGILRMLLSRIEDLDYVVPIWPFRVGFTYLADRESSSNMYLEPFSASVWWSCLVIIGVLALVQRVTSKSRQEKDGALYTVVATWLQQDASAVPDGLSGRWSFTVLSICAMLVHAYYTSAIVSALMSTGRGGPDSLRTLADSKYAIASEDYDYFRYLYFDVKTTWEDLEYLKKRKMTSKFYQDIHRGVELIDQGNTAFNSEYNQIYPHFKSFSDDHICKLQHVDIIPETLTWVTTAKRGQWMSVLRPAGAWLHEIGLAKRLVSRLRIPKPPCRASLLAERVKLGDVAPLLALSAIGTILSWMLLGFEVLADKWKKKGRKGRVLMRESSGLSVTY